jgi:23S rRNA pseudouridine1911/1915/1917 synthase
LKDAEPAVEEPIINRVALHAWTLEFKHPTTKKLVKFEAPLPEDMQNLLEMLRKYRKI